MKANIEILKKNLEPIKRHLDSDKKSILTPTMIVLAESCRESMEKKGQAFNYRILRYTEDGANSFEDFLKNLKNGKIPIPANKRIQILLSVEGVHWTAADIHLKEDNYEFFLIDSLHNIDSLTMPLNLIKESFPTSKVTACTAEVQTSEQGCGYFSLDFALTMAKMEKLHEILNAIPSEDTAIKKVFLKNLPKEFGSLVKNIQSLSRYGLCYEGKGFLRHNKKPLDDYIKSHSKLVEVKNPVTRNLALEDKVVKFKTAAKEWLDKHLAEIKEDASPPPPSRSI